MTTWKRNLTIPRILPPSLHPRRLGIDKVFWAGLWGSEEQQITLIQSLSNPTPRLGTFSDNVGGTPRPKTEGQCCCADLRSSCRELACVCSAAIPADEAGPAAAPSLRNTVGCWLLNSESQKRAKIPSDKKAFDIVAASSSGMSYPFRAREHASLSLAQYSDRKLQRHGRIMAMKQSDVAEERPYSWVFVVASRCSSMAQRELGSRYQVYSELAHAIRN